MGLGGRGAFWVEGFRFGGAAYRLEGFGAFGSLGLRACEGALIKGGLGASGLRAFRVEGCQNSL